MKRLHLPLIALSVATFGCTRQHFPDDPFNGPAISAPASGAPELPTGSGDSYVPGSRIQPDAGLQSSYTTPLVQAPSAHVDVPETTEPLSGAAPQEFQPDWTSSVPATEPLPGNEQTVVPIGHVDDAEQRHAEPAVPEPPAAPVDADEQFGGRDPEFRWIRGKLDYVSMDRKWQVRYAPYSVEDDRFGGSLLLEDDARLKDFRRGDVVYIEGEIVKQPTRMIPDNAVYRIKQIRKDEVATPASSPPQP